MDGGHTTSKPWRGIGGKGQIGREFEGPLGQPWPDQESWCRQPETWLVGCLSLAVWSWTSRSPSQDLGFLSYKNEENNTSLYASLDGFDNGVK